MILIVFLMLIGFQKKVDWLMNDAYFFHFLSFKNLQNLILKIKNTLLKKWMVLSEKSDVESCLVWPALWIFKSIDICSILVSFKIRHD